MNEGTTVVRETRMYCHAYCSWQIAVSRGSVPHVLPRQQTGDANTSRRILPAQVLALTQLWSSLPESALSLRCNSDGANAVCRVHVIGAEASGAV